MLALAIVAEIAEAGQATDDNTRQRSRAAPDATAGRVRPWYAQLPLAQSFLAGDSDGEEPARCFSPQPPILRRIL